MYPGIVSAALSGQHMEVVFRHGVILTHIQMQITNRPLFALKYRGLSDGW